MSKTGITLNDLQDTLDKIKNKYMIGDKVFLVKNRVGNLTVFVNDISVGYIDFGNAAFEQWEHPDWGYHLSEHAYPSEG